MRFVEKHKGTPFFLSLHYTAPHWPWETRDDEAEAQRIDRLDHTDGGSVETYAAVIRHMDEGIGRLLQSLDDDTLVVFTSDNGGERFSDSWPLVGKKMDLLEGGIRVPYIVRRPKVVPAGRTSAQLAITDRQQKAVRSGAWKWLSIEGHDYLFDLSRAASRACSRSSRTSTPPGRRACRRCRPTLGFRSSTGRPRFPRRPEQRDLV